MAAVHINPPSPSRHEIKRHRHELFGQQPDLAARFRALADLGTRVRGCEVHLTTTCNIRCTGCWYFEGGFDQAVHETNDIGKIRAFAENLAVRGYTQATLIGGEPTLVLNRIEPFVEHLPYLTVSTNGLRRFPMAAFENVAVGVSLFGGGPLDDALRAHRVNGSSFTGLFETALSHYRGDPRVTFVFALSEDGLDQIEPTVQAIEDNGNIVTFNFYSAHGTDKPLRIENERRTLDAALAAKERHPDTVVCHPYYINTLITGRTHWGGTFGYDVCPSISVDMPVHEQRVGNGNPTLDGFAVYGADYEQLQFCCTSGDCDGCRDSQAVYSWLMLSSSRFLDSVERFETWLELAESYWRQWYWSQQHAPAFARTPAAD
jgi:hypothetical protein